MFPSLAWHLSEKCPDGVHITQPMGYCPKYDSLPQGRQCYVLPGMTWGRKHSKHNPFPMYHLMVYSMITLRAMVALQVATAEQERIQPDAAEREPLAMSASRAACLMQSCLGEHKSGQKPHGPRTKLLNLHSCLPSFPR